MDKAAATLGISPKTVALNIKHLHTTYRIKFMDSVEGHLVLTDAGQMLYTIARHIFKLEKLAEFRIQEFQRLLQPQKQAAPSIQNESETAKLIRIHATETFATYYLPAITSAFKQLKPQIEVQIKVLPLQTLVDATIQRKNDIAFVSEYIQDDKLSIRELIEDKLVVITAPHHPLTKLTEIKPLNLDGQFLVMHENDPIQQDAIDMFIEDKNILLFKHLVFSSYEAIKQAVIDNAGVSVLCNKIVSDKVRQKQLAAIPLANHTITQKFYLIWRKDEILSPLMGSFIEIAFKWGESYLRSLSIQP